jgi:protein gp37
MGETEIEWTDKTWNPVTGCSKVSPGCAHCYAEGVALRFWSAQYPWVEVETGGPAGTKTRARQFTDVQCHEDRLGQPRSWQKPQRVFVNSMSDLFHEDVPDAFIAHVFNVMADCPQHTFQILTKRAQRMHDLMDGPKRHDQWTPKMWHREVLPNVWLGPSVENQRMADERLPHAAALAGLGWNVMVSMEPLLSAVTLPPTILALGRKAWIIAGGESGREARPCDRRWLYSIQRQCSDAGVPFFCKQLGAKSIIDGVTDYPLPLKNKKGGDIDEWPPDLRVRQFPTSPQKERQ